MPLCFGKTKDGKSANHTQATICKCNKCGSVGCESKDCTNRAFEGTKCLKCGASCSMGSGRTKV